MKNYFQVFHRPGLRLKCLVLAGALAISFSPALSTGHPLDSPGEEIDLVGIAGPYNFYRFCRLASGELWTVGGYGTVQYMDELNSREKRITDKSLNSIFFANSYDGWVVGDKGTIFHTEDQGGSWRRQISGTKENLEAIACTNERHCWAVGKNGLILSTDNRGNLWKKIESGIFADLFAISFVNNKVGWIAGEDGFILHTTDAGESWEKQRAIIMLFPDGPFAAPTNLQAIKFINENQGWVAGAGGIAYTVDAGKTWQVEHLEETFIGLVSTDKNTVWAVSDAGTNYMTKVGGSPWLPVSSQRISAK